MVGTDLRPSLSAPHMPTIAQVGTFERAHLGPRASWSTCSSERAVSRRARPDPGVHVRPVACLGSGACVKFPTCAQFLSACPGTMGARAQESGAHAHFHACARLGTRGEHTPEPGVCASRNQWRVCLGTRGMRQVPCERAQSPTHVVGS